MRKALFSLFVAITMFGCGKKHHNELFYDYDCKVVLMNGEGIIPMGKFHTLTPVKTVLFQSIADTTLFCEMYSNQDRMVNNEWFYNHRVGDTAHFEYIRKSRFFTIKPRTMTH